MKPDLRVAMVPSPGTLDVQTPGGITTIVRKYAEFLPLAGIEIVEPHDDDWQVAAVHAGTAEPPPNMPFVCHCHGLYWSAHYKTEMWQAHGNQLVMRNIRHANAVTVPSDWVAETFRRDMHFTPVIVPHGVNVEEFKPEREHENFVLWNKNRATDVCTPRAVHELAERRPDRLFLTTFADSEPTPNIKVTGLLDYSAMREIVKIAGVYLASVEETFGIATLEAMAAGVPVLGFTHGGTPELVRHGVNGYLARPGDYDDLARGLDYCYAHRAVLGANGAEMAKKWTWENVAHSVRAVYEQAIIDFSAPYNVTVVIPCFNKVETLERAVWSALEQDHVGEIVIVDNNSSDMSGAIAQQLEEDHDKVTFLECAEQGVAHARNAGCDWARTRYISCLDADDEMLPGFIDSCVKALRKNPDLGIAYTRMEVVNPDGQTVVSQWPGEFDYVRQAQKSNQVPTCCVFRRDIYQRLGGYRQRYAPRGAGAEDAELWYRFGSVGYGAILADQTPRFRYYLGGQVSGDPNYQEADWLVWHPEVITGDYSSSSIYPPPDGYSHSVRKYNRPVVSVIIPCTPEHLQYVYDAIDSLEAQTFKAWECIVSYDDSGEHEESAAGREEDLVRLATAFPFVRIAYPEVPGAGAARNAGAAIAKADNLLFVDADDWLEPQCLEVMADVASAEPDDIVYTDYIGRAYGVTNHEELERAGRLIYYEEETQFAIMRYYSADFDCARALRQPDMQDDGHFYIWNLITSWTPKSAHEEIGGFDEEMESWEDWDYWIRMARAGRCFVRIQRPLVSYRFYTGTRREIGRQQAPDLLDYLRAKYEGDEPMPCGGCGGKRVNPVVTMTANSEQPITAYSANELVRVEFLVDSFGTSITIRDTDTNQLHDYGFRSGGDTFMMLRKHAERFPAKFRVIEDVGTVQAEPIIETEPPPEPEPIIEEPKPEPKKKRAPRKRRASRSKRNTS